MKIQINGQFRKMDYVSFWEIFFIKCFYKEDFKDVLYFVEMVFVFSISAVQCERVVSVQNRIKGSIRVIFIVLVLEDLIRLFFEGLFVAEFDLSLAVDQWFLRDKLKGERLRRVYFLNDDELY